MVKQRREETPMGEVQEIGQAGFGWPVEELWVGSVGTVSVEVDWTERWGEGDGWYSFEAPDCPTCGDYGTWDTAAHEWVCANDDCGDRGQVVEVEDGGPMMNYYYPLEDLGRFRDDVYAAAEAIRDLPLCVVEFADGVRALALTGGGMDLSWEICAAFCRLGFLPPLHFCDLPNMAGKTPLNSHDRYVVDACLRSAEVAAGWASRTRERLVEQYGETGD